VTSTTSVDGDVTRYTVAQAVTTAVAGPSVSILTSQRIVVEEDLVDEMPGASVTMKIYGEQVGQSFQFSFSPSWTLAAPRFYLRKVGDPSDGVEVSLRTDTAGLPGTVLESATVDSSDIDDDAAWIPIPFSNTTVLSQNTTYWLTVERTDTHNALHYYEIGVDESLAYPDGTLTVWDGSAWQVRPADADLLFELTSASETTVQLREMIESSEFLTVGSVVSTGLASLQYRDGETTTLREVLDLLAQGTASGLRLLATVTHDRRVDVMTEPTLDNADALVDIDGVATDTWGVPFPRSRPPVGVWLRPHALIPPLAGARRRADSSAIFVERAEWRALGNRVRFEPRAVPSVWQVGDLKDG
jgi:hypothetical protein